MKIRLVISKYRTEYPTKFSTQSGSKTGGGDHKQDPAHKIDLMVGQVDRFCLL